MRPLLRAELIKLRTTRTFVALAGVAVATSVLIVSLVSLLSEPTEESVLTDVFTSDTSSLFITVLAIVGITGEWRHRTLTSSLLAAPDRMRFLAAKVLAFAAAGAVLSLLISIGIGIVGYVLLSSRDLPTPELGELLAQIGRNVLVAALLGGFGVGFGSLVRNQAVAIVSILLLGFLIEPTLLALAPDVGIYGPFTGLPTAVQDIPADDVGFEDAEFLSPLAAVFGMLAWIGLLFAGGATLLRRRDLD
jgi:ABC-2 type transport system permease protein